MKTQQDEIVIYESSSSSSSDDESEIKDNEPIIHHFKNFEDEPPPDLLFEAYPEKNIVKKHIKKYMMIFLGVVQIINIGVLLYYFS